MLVAARMARLGKMGKELALVLGYSRLQSRLAGQLSRYRRFLEMTFDRLHAPLNPTAPASSPLVEARFIPRQYEPNYAYPLLVLFHGRGGDEEQLVRAMPALSWRNYVGLGLRGPEPVTKRDRLAGFGWGAEFEQPGRRRLEPSVAVSEAELVRRLLFNSEPEAIDRLEEAVFTRSCRLGTCSTSTPSGSSWWGPAKVPPSPTGLG